DPEEPPDTPAVTTFNFASNGQVVAAPSSTGGDTDYFLDVALPWSALDVLGLAPATAMGAWLITADGDGNLRGDYACHQGGGIPGLEDIDGDPVVADPEHDSDGDGYPDQDEIDGGSDPNDPNSIPGAGGGVRYEGGGGCTAAKGAGGSG